MTIMGVTGSASVVVQSLADLRAKLDDLQRQLGTGQTSDNYAGLGSQRSLVVGLQSQLDAAQGFDDTITMVGTRLSIAQTALTQISQSAQNVQSILVQQDFTLGQNGQTVNQQSAQGELDSILAAVDSQDATGYIFSGLATNQAAVDSLDHIMNGNGAQAGFKQVLSERQQADGANGLGRLLIPPPAGTVVTVSEDAAGSPFGLKLAGVNSTLTGTIVAGPAGVPPAISVNVQTNPNAGEMLNLSFTLPDGSSENLTLTATTSNPPGANQFTIGATAAATAANLQAALTTAVSKLADTSLVAASAVAAAKDFFDTDAANPPQRVNGPPFNTATSLIAGTPSNTVTWYTGEAGASPARSTAIARVDPAVTISFGMRANEQGLRNVVKNVAVFAAMSFSANDPNAADQYSALTARLAANFAPSQGTQTVADIQTELVNAQTMANTAKDRHTQSTATLTDFLQKIENVSPDQVGTELLSVQTALQASLQTTAMLSKLSLINYLPIS